MRCKCTFSVAESVQIKRQRAPAIAKNSDEAQISVIAIDSVVVFIVRVLDSKNDGQDDDDKQKHSHTLDRSGFLRNFVGLQTMPERLSNGGRIDYFLTA